MRLLFGLSSLCIHLCVCITFRACNAELSVFHSVRRFCVTDSFDAGNLVSITAIANVVHIPYYRITTAQAVDAHEKYPPCAGGEYMSPAYYCGDNIMAILRSLPGGPDYSGARAARAARRRRDRRRRRQSANKGGESGSEQKASAQGAASGTGDAPAGLRTEVRPGQRGELETKGSAAAGGEEGEGKGGGKSEDDDGILGEEDAELLVSSMRCKRGRRRCLGSAVEYALALLDGSGHRTGRVIVCTGGAIDVGPGAAADPNAKAYLDGLGRRALDMGFSVDVVCTGGEIFHVPLLRSLSFCNGGSLLVHRG